MEQVNDEDRSPRQVIETLGGSLGISNLVVGIVEIFKSQTRGSASCTSFSECASNCEHDVECQQQCEIKHQCSPLLVDLAGGSYQAALHKAASYDCFNFASCAQFCFEPCTGNSHSETNIKDLCSIDAKCLTKCNKMNRCSKHFKVSNDLKMANSAASAVEIQQQNPAPVMTLPMPLPVIDPSNGVDNNILSCTRYCGSSCHRHCKRLMMHRSSSLPPHIESYNCFVGCLNSCNHDLCSGR